MAFTNSARLPGADPLDAGLEEAGNCSRPNPAWAVGSPRLLPRTLGLFVLDSLSEMDKSCPSLGLSLSPLHFCPTPILSTTELQGRFSNHIPHLERGLGGKLPAVGLQDPSPAFSRSTQCDRRLTHSHFFLLSPQEAGISHPVCRSDRG